MHLRYFMNGSPSGHPQKVMAELGITYSHACPFMVFDQWHFYNCRNVPEPLPKWMEVIEHPLSVYVGKGLSEDDVKKIEEAKEKGGEG